MYVLQQHKILKEDYFYVKLLWEGHKILKNLPTLAKYLVTLKQKVIFSKNSLFNINSKSWSDKKCFVSLLFYSRFIQLLTW